MTEIHFVSPASKQTSYDVIFIHGLNGHPFETWSVEGQSDCWLQWLNVDLPEARICTIEYDSVPSKWLGDEFMPIYDRAENLRALILANGLGSRPLVFIAHSLGGLLVKKLLQNDSGAASKREILSNTKAVIFLGTPNHGSDFAQSFGILRKLFRLNELTNELTANKVELRELHNWYRNNSGAHQIVTVSFFEKKDLTLGGVNLGRVVNETSSDPGIPNAQLTPIDADHIAICKPASRKELVYKSVLQFLKQTFQSTTPSQTIEKEDSSLKFATATSFVETVQALEDQLYFCWEQGSFDSSKDAPVIYWPVRLRHPTFIHAAQAFAAGGLQQRGAEVCLFIDDLGVQDYATADLSARLSKWFAQVGGDPNQLQLATFSQIIPQDDLANEGSADPWPAIRKWLGATAYRLDEILRVSKLFPASGKWEELAEKRPRRLLTPAMVWTCLSHVQASSPERSYVTLGGYDEKPLWDAWRGQRILPESNVGHLYAPQLIDSEKQHIDTPLHMANPLSYSLRWISKDDIRQALGKEFETDRWKENGRLVWWCLRSCVFLPRYFRGEEVSLELSTGVIGPETSLQSVLPDELSSALTQELAKWL